MVGLWTLPRARAAWRVHALGAALADYSLCMVGPTGPDLIRDDSAAFRQLVRRRLVTAAPDEAPFLRCAAAARQITDSTEVERSHAAHAQTYAEYGAPELGSERHTLAELRVDSSYLLECTRAAWPFVRGGFARLVRPSLGAREAVHPVAPAHPSVGRGLPAGRGMPNNAWRSVESLLVSLGNNAGQSSYLSSDWGQTFRLVARAPGAEERSGRCVGKDPRRGFVLTSAGDGALLVSAFSDGRSGEAQTAVSSEHRLQAVACDDDALVLAARVDGSKDTRVVLCRFGRTCAPLVLPSITPFSPLRADSFDVARVAGATVVAVESRGIVRVISTRDDGASWTPPNVAFDAAEQRLGTDVAAPTRLIAFGSRLLLYGAASKNSQSYPLLVSDDQGASFRGIAAAPRTSSEVLRASSDPR